MTAPRVNVIPSPLAGLADASQTILDALLARAQLELQERRIRAEEERVELARRAADADERAAAFDRIIKMAPFIQPGSTLAENDFLHKDFQLVFPGSDPTMSQLALNPETIETILLPEFKEAAKTLTPERREAIFERGLNKIIIGEALSGEELELQGQVLEVQKRGLQALLGDARFQEDAARRLAGLEQKIRLRVPDEQGRLVDIEFDTADAARISAALWEHWDLLAWQERKFALEERAKTDVAKEFMEVAKERKLLITRPQALAIIGAVHSDDPAEAVRALQQSPAWNETLDAALQLYIGGFNLATDSPIPEIARFPGLQLYMALGAEFESRFGKDATAKLLPSVASVLRREGVQIGGARGFAERLAEQPLGLGLFGSRFIAGPQEGEPAQVPAEGITPELISAVRDALAAGEVTEEFVAQKYGLGVLSAAKGETPAPQQEGRRPAPDDPVQRRLRSKLSQLEASIVLEEERVRTAEQAVADAQDDGARAVAGARLVAARRSLDRLRSQAETIRGRLVPGTGGRF